MFFLKFLSFEFWVNEEKTLEGIMSLYEVNKIWKYDKEKLSKKGFSSNIFFYSKEGKRWLILDSLKQNSGPIFASLQPLENVLGKFANPFSAFAHSSGEVLGKTMRSNFLFSRTHPLSSWKPFPDFTLWERCSGEGKDTRRNKLHSFAVVGAGMGVLASPPI